MLVALLSSLCLAVLGLTLFLWRVRWRRQISGYRWVTDWLGHGGTHAVGMILMAALMLGWAPAIGPPWAYLIGYGALTLFFALRGVMARDVTSRSDGLRHAFVQLSMVYMFGVVWQGPVVALTAGFLVFYGAVSADHVRHAAQSFGPDAVLRGDCGPGRAAGTLGHLAISCSMVIMFITMQWPALFRGSA